MIENARFVVDEQAEDEGLWFVAETMTEAYLQSALRRLHAAVENVPQWGFTPALGKRIVYYEYPSRGGVYFWDGEKLSLQE